MCADELREPPKNINAERTVLGSMLIDYATIDVALDALHPECFYPTAHQELFRAIAGQHAANQPVDFVSVAEALERAGKLETVGGRSYIAGLEQDVLTTQNVDYYCELVRDAWKRRELIKAAHNIIEDSHQSDLPAAELIERSEKRIFQITTERTGKDFLSMGAVAHRAMEDLEARSRDYHEVTGVRSHFDHLDELTAGFQRGELIILAGRTSMGKTAFGLNILANITLGDNKPAAIFSLEMNAASLHNRILALRSKTPLNFIRAGVRKRSRLEELREINARIAGAPLYIDDSSALTTTQLRARARRLKAEIPELALIMVDYLQLMRQSESRRANENRQVEVAEISRSLKILAGELRIPVVALAQVNRGPENRPGSNKRPQLSDLRESGAIEQDADVVIFVHRERTGQPTEQGDVPHENFEGLPEQAEIIVAKQRNGAVGTVEINFWGASTRFGTLDKNYWKRWS